MKFLTINTESTSNIAALKNSSVFIHASSERLESVSLGKFELINTLSDILLENGYHDIYLCEESSIIQKLAKCDKRHIHIVMADIPLIGDNIFFCIPAYLRGFWYFDSVGTRNNSSIRYEKFSPKGMSNKYALDFFERMRKRYVEKNTSKYEQIISPNVKIKKGSICIFAQQFDDPKHYKHYFTYPELIENVIANKEGRHVYIKPHPLQTFDEAEKLLQYHAPDNGVEVIMESVHVLLAEAALAITLSSAVAFEANLHKVPAILGGETDFHHNAITITSKEEMKLGMVKALSQNFHYEKYLTWFLTHQLVRPIRKKKTEEKIRTVLGDLV